MRIMEQRGYRTEENVKGEKEFIIIVAEFDR